MRLEHEALRPQVLPMALILLSACLALPGCAEPAERQGSVPTAVLLGRVFDSATGDVIPDGAVVIAGDRVACSGERDKCRWSEGTPEHRYEGATILPGLIDLHGHIRSHFVAAYLPAGVTTVRDVSNTVGTIRDGRDRSDAPRIVATGPELDGSESFLASASSTAGRPHQVSLDDAIPILIKEEGDVGAAVRILADQGMEWMKLREMLDTPHFQALVVAGRERGLRATADLGLVVTGGLGGPSIDIVEAAEMGLSSVEHFSGLALAYGRRGGDPLSEHLDEAIMDEIAAELLESGIHHVPTAAVLQQIQDAGRLAPYDLPGWNALGPYFEGHWQRLEGVTAAVHDEISADLRLWQAMLDRVRRGGAVIGAGSDAPNAPYLVPAVGLHQELAALVAAGLTPVEALQAATANAATILDRSDIGTLRAGAYADVLVVRGEPLADIHETRRVLAVWASGNKIDLDAAWAQVRQDLAALEGPVWHPTER